MVRFLQKDFADGLVGDEYQSAKQKRRNEVIPESLKEIEKHKEDRENNSGSMFNKINNKGGFKKFKTKKIKEKEASLDRLVNEENIRGFISNKSLYRHGLKYGKKSK